MLLVEGQAEGVVLLPLEIATIGIALLQEQIVQEALHHLEAITLLPEEAVQLQGRVEVPHLQGAIIPHRIAVALHLDQVDLGVQALQGLIIALPIEAAQHLELAEAHHLLEVIVLQEAEAVHPQGRAVQGAQAHLDPIVHQGQVPLGHRRVEAHHLAQTEVLRVEVQVEEGSPF